MPLGSALFTTIYNQPNTMNIRDAHNIPMYYSCGPDDLVRDTIRFPKASPCEFFVGSGVHPAFCCPVEDQEFESLTLQRVVALHQPRGRQVRLTEHQSLKQIEM